MAREIIRISYHISNSGYARPEKNGRRNIRDNRGMKIKDDKGLDSMFFMI